MKYVLILLIFFVTIKAGAQENYVLQIGDKSFSISEDSSYQVVVNGKKLNLLLRQKDTLSFKDTLFSFSYPKGYQYSTTNIEDAALQYAIITAAGNGYMIQKYWTLNPISITELMLQEVIKERLGYGYSMKREDYKRTLKSGQTLNVLKAVLTYRGEINTYEVAAIGGKDEGIVVITIDNALEQAISGREMIKLMWSSLQYIR